MPSPPTDCFQEVFNSHSPQDVPCSCKKPAIDFGGVDPEDQSCSHKIDIAGYSGLFWQNPREEGFKNYQNDHEETQCWVWTQNYGWKVWNADGEELWLCKLCHRGSSPEQHWFKCSKSTTRAKGHMKKKHGISARGSRLHPEQNDKKRKLDNYMNVYDTSTCISSALPVSSSSLGFWKMYLQCIIADEVPLPGRDSTHLQLLITSASPQNRLPPLEAVSSWIKKTYDRQLSIAADVLTSAATKVSMSPMIHTSGGRAKLLGVRTYFIDHSGRPTTMFVSMPRRQNGHTTFGTADMVSAIIDEHHLERSLGYIATDDVSNSAACAFLAAFTCHPAGNDRRLQCFADLLDSLAQSILLGCAAKSLEGELVAVGNNKKEQTSIWRKRGPYGKLHNIIHYVKRSSQREERLSDIQRRSCAGKPSMGRSETSKLLQDKGTRWESMNDSIGRALHLRSALHEFVNKEMEDEDASQPSIAQDCLASREWEVLEVYHDILQHIGNTVEVLQGEKDSFGAIWQVLPQFEALLDRLDQNRRCELPQDEERAIPARLQDAERDGPIVVAGQNCVVGTGPNGTAKQPHGVATQVEDPTAIRNRFNINVDNVFVQYELNARLDAALQQNQDLCETLRGNTLYVAAVVLHPRIKWRFFESKWKDRRDRLNTMKEVLSEYWRNKYSDTVARSHPVSRAANSDDTRAPDEWSDEEASDVDQFEEYQGELPDKSYESTESPVCYWMRMRRRWPQLATMALDIYSVPVMAGKSELRSTRLTKDYSLKEEGLDDETEACLACFTIWQRDGGTIEMDDSLFE